MNERFINDILPWKVLFTKGYRRHPLAALTGVNQSRQGALLDGEGRVKIGIAAWESVIAGFRKV
ncbi:hypothetical protein [Noviherbaspirillum autotrophicum]|uniref:hypothetical protein n=1 Tax=Noviherbaspirillum autotrophicum TaxID=709839 RepID=UPI000A80A0B7|nr:hypothetical protein [Noviherbaspirillum autotrophicum]